MRRLALILMCAEWCSASAKICVGGLQRALLAADATLGQVRRRAVGEGHPTQRAGLPAAAWWRRVDVLAFRSTDLDGVRVDSVAIEGPSPAIDTLLAVPRRVCTNVGAEGVWRSLALP